MKLLSSVQAGLKYPFHYAWYFHNRLHNLHIMQTTLRSIFIYLNSEEFYAKTIL